MSQELSFEYRVLGGSVADAMTSIIHIDDRDELESLLLHEQQHMNRSTVTKALKRRLKKTGNRHD